MASRVLAILGRMDKLGRAIENVFLVTLLSGLMLLQFGQIALRQFFDTGFIWADELLKLMVLWLAMIAAIAACRDNRHIRIDALSHLLPDTAIRVTRIIVDVFAAGVCFVVAWHAWRYLQLEIEFEDTVLIETPAWLVHSVVPIAFALTGYRFVVGALKRAVGLEAGDERGAVV